MSITELNAYKTLVHCAHELENVHLRELFDADPRRVQRFTREFGALHYDFSKQRMTQEILDNLIALAKEAGVEKARDRMFAGDVINTSEKRQVLHVALRSSKNPFPENNNVMNDVLRTRERLFAFAKGIRSGALKGSTGKLITDVVNIGIGGSDLGPKMMSTALRAIDKKGPAVHYVSNLDSAQMASLLPTLNAETTLFIIVSKTFTTQETMMNAKTARSWLTQSLAADADLSCHLAAVSSRPQLAADFGIPAERVFPIWDWVGGRYSLWSAVGLALLIQIGPDAFERLLKAAEAMDNHFCTAPLEENLPILMALIGFWNSTILGAETLAILPYNESLKYFPSFLQQLEMESNGKCVGINGQPVQTTTCPIVWGELGNNGQHAFFQLLHQGTRLVPCDFIAAARADYPLPGHQEALLSNCFAQSSALAFGKTAAEVQKSMQEEGKSEEEIAALTSQRTFRGNQPSSTLMLESLSPEALGALVALYEHKVFVQGILWGLNSFDQWGVELGKAVAKKILPKLSNIDNSLSFDASTESLIAYTKKYL